MAEHGASGGWSTIESDQGVFTSLIEQLGVQDIQFEELLELDESAIRALSPVYGVIFLFKWIGSTGASNDQPREGTYDQSATEDDGLFFAAQTIQNACGTQAILSVILNNDATSDAHPSGADRSLERINIGPNLQEFKEFTTGFPSDLRGEALSNSDLIRETHNTFARSSPFADETQRDPDAGSEDVFHFIGYTSHHGKLYELDGLQPYPINHGSCTPDEFPAKIIPVLQKRISRYPMDELRFNLMAVCGDLRKKAEAFGDFEMLANQKRIRKRWAWENALRKHNFVGFTGEILKGVVSMKVQGGNYNDWVEQAKETTEKRYQDKKARTQNLEG